MMHQNLNINVTVKVADLIAALEKNKKKHQEDYKKALEVFFKELDQELHALWSHAHNKNLAVKYTYNKSKPVDNSALYDKYIGMFKMSVEETSNISAEDYGCIVDDNWEWALSANLLNMAYSSKFGG